MVDTGPCRTRIHGCRVFQPVWEFYPHIITLPVPNLSTSCLQLVTKHSGNPGLHRTMAPLVSKVLHLWQVVLLGDQPHEGQISN